MMDSQKCSGDCHECASSQAGHMMMDCCVMHKMSKEHLKMKKEMLEKKLKMVKVELEKRSPRGRGK